MPEVPFVCKTDKLALATDATSHFVQSSSASRFAFEDALGLIISAHRLLPGLDPSSLCFPLVAVVTGNFLHEHHDPAPHGGIIKSHERSDQP
jgi:hypothetical protein